MILTYQDFSIAVRYAFSLNYEIILENRLLFSLEKMKSWLRICRPWQFFKNFQIPSCRFSRFFLGWKSQGILSLFSNMEKSPRSHSSNILLVTYSWSELDFDSHRIFSRDFLFEKFEGLMKCIWKVKAAQFELIFFFFLTRLL